MVNRMQFHPALRKMPEDYLTTRSGWWRLIYPSSEQIHWYGDVQIFCRVADYHQILAAVPCPTAGEGEDRRCVYAGADLDAWRAEVNRWLACFDESGALVREWRPAVVPVTQEPKIVAGPEPVKRAPWFGRGLMQYLRRGRPD